MTATASDPRDKNVLLICPEFPYSYWSFKEPFRLLGIKTMNPPLGLLTVAALLPPNWNLRLVDENVRKITQADWDFCDMVMLTAMVVQEDEAAALIREAKQRGKTVVVGGPHASSVPKVMLDAGADIVVKGEAETAMAPLLKALDRGETGIIVEETHKPDMSLSPIPRWDLIDIWDYGNMSVQTSRGCPFDCEFCDIVSLFGRKPRYKTPEQFIAELETLYQLGHRGSVFICDDNFIGNKQNTKALLEALIPWMESRGKPFGFICQASVNLGQEPELVDLMTEACIGDVFIGIETPDEDSLRLTNKIQNIRIPMAENLDYLIRNGLSILGSFIVGLEGEKPGATQRLCSFVEEMDITIAMINLLTALPNTRLYERLNKEGRLKSVTKITDTQMGHMNLIPDRPEEEIVAEYFYAIDYLYEPSRLMARAYRNLMKLRPTRAALAKARGEEPKPMPVPRALPPLKRQIKDMKLVLTIFWRHGIAAKYRGQFWRQLINVRRKNPSRLRRYFIFLGYAESLYDFRRQAKQWKKLRGLET
jgi:radical SAM superfamily enzyme YgiQ (UPF0313 family)